MNDDIKHWKIYFVNDEHLERYAGNFMGTLHDVHETVKIWISVQRSLYGNKIRRYVVENVDNTNEKYTRLC